MRSIKEFLFGKKKDKDKKKKKEKNAYQQVKENANKQEGVFGNISRRRQAMDDLLNE